MPVKKPNSRFGLNEAVWLVFIFGFLVLLCTAGCKSVGTVPERERINRHTI